jgi:glycine dehydrogenase
VKAKNVNAIREKALRQQINLRYFEKDLIGISIDETTMIGDLYDLINCFENDKDPVAFGHSISGRMRNWSTFLILLFAGRTILLILYSTRITVKAR